MAAPDLLFNLRNPPLTTATSLTSLMTTPLNATPSFFALTLLSVVTNLSSMRSRILLLFLFKLLNCSLFTYLLLILSIFFCHCFALMQVSIWSRELNTVMLVSRNLSPSA
ncbi:hypothetical protein RND81_01G081800 [Saponaria officinalis]|uniref:Uncharacterized protein n=1 Tax=Saponaria officinalis TaxID=3572 RepID=A0AAW1NDP2_SAPOF